MRISSIFLLLVAGCAVNLGSAEGIVVDSATGKGLADAFVVVSWNFHGADIAGSRTSCADVAVVRADAGGRFRLPPGPGGIGLERQVSAYVPGYERDRTVPYDETRLAQRLFKGSGEARMESLGRFWYLGDCGPRTEKPSKLRTLYQALDQEVNTLQFVGRQRYDLPDAFVKSLRPGTLERMESERRR